MAKGRGRVRLGLLYSYNENWIGGVYYILNMVKQLSLIPDEQKPKLVVFYSNANDLKGLKELKYKFITYIHLEHQLPLKYKVLNKVNRLLTLPVKHFNYICDANIDILFPLMGYEDEALTARLSESKKVYWIPDFQEHYYPDFFDASEIEVRKKVQNRLAKDNVNLVLSSQAAANDFDRFFPYNSCNKHVLPFTVNHPVYSHINIIDLKAKYNLPANYMFSPNQFWKHKNQIIILKAVRRLKEQGFNVNVVFTGKEFDHRDPNYFPNLKDHVKANDLCNNIYFLGFIDRGEQLCLMQHAKAVIQPSLFEGWSTVVEDTKALNKFILASDIPVHREQLKNNYLFFDPNDEIELADKIKQTLTNEPKIEPNNYEINQIQYGSAIVRMLQKFRS